MEAESPLRIADHIRALETTLVKLQSSVLPS